MTRYRKILNPLSSGGDNETQPGLNADADSVECVLRFPFFNKVWNDEVIDFYESDALDHFPTKDNVWFMLPTGDYEKFPMSPGDAFFWNNLKSCSAPEIYFFDSYFSKKNLARLLDIILFMDSQIRQAETHIYIYTVPGNEMTSLETEFAKHQEEYPRWEKLKLSIYCIKQGIAAKMHDRFALLGQSLWHFGASAGAMHTNINAYSGPWPDKGGKCREFMRDIRVCDLAEKRLSTEKGFRVKR